MKQDYETSFEIKLRPNPPIITSTDPANHDFDVLPETIIRIDFSTPMDTKITEQCLVIIPNTDLPLGYAILWDRGNRRLSFYFAQNMRPGEDYYLTITTKAVSEDGIYLENNYNFTFQVMSC